jgi:oligoendopeptidase F
VSGEASASEAGDWDLTPYFEEYGGAQYRSFRDDLASDTADLLAEALRLETIEAENLQEWRDLLARLEQVHSRSNHLAGYLGCCGAADSRDQDVQRETASAAAARAELEKVFVLVRAAMREVSHERFEDLVAGQSPADRSPADGSLARRRYFLERMRERARLSMPPELETLAAELDVSGLSAWGRLYDQVSGKLSFEFAAPGEKVKRLPVSATRSLLEDPDRAVRSAALSGSNAAWESVADVAAACLNNIAGTRHTLYARREIDHFLAPAAFDAGIERTTLLTLLSVVAERAEVGRRYLRQKAKLLGRERLGFQDLMAPLPLSSHRKIPWDEARERVLAAFAAFSPSLSEFAEQAFARNWIDFRSRPGKRPGGFCSTSPWIGESRIFISYGETLGDLSTLAHELGHAFHGWVMRDMPAWQRRYPMTLGETASTFAEQLMIDAVLASPEAGMEERACMLDSRMQDAAAFLLNIPMRFHFERAVYEERLQGELSVARLKELMESAQREWYGDALSPEELDPWFWASKLHFYLTGISFYNFPYTFGYLFSLGLFARSKQEGPEFVDRYVALLRQSGSDSAERVAKSCLGIDLAAPDFWHASIDGIEQDAKQFESSVDALFGTPPTP